MTDTEKAQHLARLNALITAWNAAPHDAHRTRALRSLNLSVKFLRGEKVPAWVADSFV